jgi:hypothetical protein
MNKQIHSNPINMATAVASASNTAVAPAPVVAAVESPTECSICVSPFNKTSRKMVDCGRCDEKVCMECVKKYFDTTINDPHCMHCHHAWDLFYVNKTMSRNYMTSQWKSTRSDLLFRREQSFFPETMPLVALEVEKEGLVEELSKIAEQEVTLRQRKVEIQRRHNAILYRQNHPNEPVEAGGGVVAGGAVRSTTFSIRQCATANCKGFLDNKGHCILCNKSTCLRCNVIVHPKPEEGGQPAHECREDDLQTWDLIRSSSKPCPNCGTRTQRTEGCAQMFCIGCHKAWNWNTGKIETGPVHNPHYYEWAARIGVENLQQQQLQDPCNRRVVWNYWHFNNLVRDNTSSIAGLGDKFRRVHQYLNHIAHHEVESSRNRVNQNNTDLRISYLRNKIDDAVYKKKLIAREIQRQKDVRLLDVYETLSMVSEQLLLDLSNRRLTFPQFFDRLKEAQKFVNENIGEINACFKSNISPMTISGL